MTTVIHMLTSTPMIMVLTFMMSTMTMNTTNTTIQNIQAPSQSENENEGEITEALMLEEDDDNPIHDDGFDQ
jgi:hypothetical protein